MADQIKSFVSNLVASAIWDLLKRVLGSALVLALATAIWEKLKRGTLDWLAIGGIFLLTILVVGSIFRHKLKQVAVSNGAHPTGDGETNWKQLYLEVNQRSSQLANDYAQAENKALLLQRKVDELSKPDDSLLVRLTTLIHDVLTFLRNQGPGPELEDGQLGTEAGRRFYGEMEKRIHKVHSGFSIRLHPLIDRVTLELGEKGIFDYDLAQLMQNQAHSEANISEIARKLMKLRDRLEILDYSGYDETT